MAKSSNYQLSHLIFKHEPSKVIFFLSNTVCSCHLEMSSRESDAPVSGQRSCMHETNAASDLTLSHQYFPLENAV